MPRLNTILLSKSYGGIPALSGVDFELRAGEVHALVGENGAGKSTLCRMLCGLLIPDSGRMTLHGQPYAPRSRRDAESRAGVQAASPATDDISGSRIGPRAEPYAAWPHG